MCGHYLIINLFLGMYQEIHPQGCIRKSIPRDVSGNPSPGMYQDIHPYSDINIDRVKTKCSLTMMREWERPCSICWCLCLKVKKSCQQEEVEAFIPTDRGSHCVFKLSLGHDKALPPSKSQIVQNRRKERRGQNTSRSGLDRWSRLMEETVCSGSLLVTIRLFLPPNQGT